MRSVEKIEGAKYRALVNYESYCSKGDILILEADDDSRCPYFYNLKNPDITFCMYTVHLTDSETQTPEVELYSRTREDILADIAVLQKELEAAPDWWEDYKKGDRIQMEFTLSSDIRDTHTWNLPFIKYKNPIVKFIKVDSSVDTGFMLIPTDRTNIKKVE